VIRSTSPKAETVRAGESGAITEHANRVKLALGQLLQESAADGGDEPSADASNA
jgi:hypothetical protein